MFTIHLRLHIQIKWGNYCLTEKNLHQRLPAQPNVTSQSCGKKNNNKKKKKTRGVWSFTLPSHTLWCWVSSLKPSGASLSHKTPGFPALCVAPCHELPHCSHSDTTHINKQRRANPHPSFPCPNYNYEITLTNKSRTHTHTQSYCPNFVETLNLREINQRASKAGVNSYFPEKMFCLQRYIVGKVAKGRQRGCAFVCFAETEKETGEKR